MVWELPQVVQDHVDQEVAKGHMLGPFNHPPLENMVYSPLNLIPKAGSPGKWCQCLYSN